MRASQVPWITGGPRNTTLREDTIARRPHCCPGNYGTYPKLILWWLNLKLGDDLRGRGHRRRVEFVTGQAIALLAPRSAPRAACAAWASRRPLVPAAPGQPRPAAASARAPAGPGAAPCPGRRRAAERSFDALHSERFADTAPAGAWATLLDEGIYLGSVQAYYRVLHQAGESRERRAQAAHPATVRPGTSGHRPEPGVLLGHHQAARPGEVDLYHLYVILDIFSRYAVGWMVATRESAVLAEKLIAATAAKQGISRGQLTIHADRGSSMTSKPAALLLADLGVAQNSAAARTSATTTRSRKASSRPSNTSQGFPRRFDSIEAARAHCQDFFGWYNNEHRHSGLGLHTAADVHHGRAAAVRASRALVLTGAYRAHRSASSADHVPADPATRS